MGKKREEIIEILEKIAKEVEDDPKVAELAEEDQRKYGSLTEKARLCVDYSEENSFVAINILRKAGFRVTSTPVSGLSEPELTLGSKSYHGIAEIQQLVEGVKEHFK